MPATTLNSIIFRDIFTTRGDAPVFSDEHRTACYLEIEAALARVQGRLGIIPAEAAREIDRKCQVENIDFAKLKATDRAHRLSDPRRGAADRRAVREGARRMVPLGRDHPGHHRHRHRHADPRGARPGRGRHGEDRSRARRSLAALPRHADGRAQQPAAGGAAHLRLQVRVPAGRDAAPPRSGSRNCARACWSASSPARSARSPSLGKDGLKVQEGADGRAQARPAGDRLAHRARPHRRGRLLPRPRHRHARQDLDGREAPDADRSRRSVRAVPRGARLVEHHAAEAQPDRLPLHPRRPPRWCARTPPRCSKPRSPTTSARPGRGRSNGSRCRKSSCSRPARCADARPGRGPAGRRRAHARQPRPHRRHDRVRGGDDGARAASRTPARARPRLRHLPRGGDRPASRWSICLPATRRSPSTSSVRSSSACAIRRTISASRARWSTACWRTSQAVEITAYFHETGYKPLKLLVFLARWVRFGKNVHRHLVSFCQEAATRPGP